MRVVVHDKALLARLAPVFEGRVGAALASHRWSAQQRHLLRTRMEQMRQLVFAAMAANMSVGDRPWVDAASEQRGAYR